MRKFMSAVLALCFFSAAAFAQGGQGRLVGTIAGPDGNIAGATVTAKDNLTGKEQTVQASGEGTYSFSQLEVGTYTVTVTAPGFKTNTFTSVKIDAGRDFTLNATLEIGNISETVEVVAGAGARPAAVGEFGHLYKNSYKKFKFVNFRPFSSSRRAT